MLCAHVRGKAKLRVCGSNLPESIDTPVTICYESLSNGLILGIVRHYTPVTNDHSLGIEFAVATKESPAPFQAELAVWLI
jgi:hypothetical protein